MINRLTQLILIITLTMMSSSVWAVAGWSFLPDAKGPDLNAAFHQRSPMEFKDDIVPDQNVTKMTLTLAEQHQAMVWGLSVDEEKRYLLLMQNQSGLHYANKDVSPVEVLGINARDDKERNYYADLYARKTLQRTAKELAFYSESGSAFNALVQQGQLPVVRSFDVDHYSPYRYEPLVLQDHDELVFFIHANDPVKPIVSSLMASITQNPSIRLYVYFIDQAITEAEINAWAKTQAAPEGLIHSKAIMLNSGESQFAKLNDKPSVPALYLLRAGVLTHISTEGF